MAVATVLIAGAVLNLKYADGVAAVPTPGEAAKYESASANASASLMRLTKNPMGKAPISIGNPATAAALEALTSTRPTTVANAPYNAKNSSDPSLDIPSAPTSYKKSLRVHAGDTLSKVLESAGAPAQDADAAILALKGIYDPRTLKAGQSIAVSFSPSGLNGEQDRFTGFEIPLNYATRIAVAPAPEGGYKAYEFERNLVTQNARADGVIDWSLFQAGSDAGVPTKVMAELVRAFSWDVDFQRDIRKDDRFEVMYERSATEDGEVVHNGQILFAALTLSGERKAIFLHTLKDGTQDYFDEAGQSAKKALMRTPIDGARLSSSFGKRKHPILGYTKLHTGTDFAAPPGTPIYAAGDGTIELAGWKGGYGKYVQIRHNSEYSTAYAHMKGFKSGITKGSRVRQGEVIGYVGTTGRSTGPHLHFEMIRRGVKVNPMRVKMPSGQKLQGTELARFEETREAVKEEWVALAQPNQQLAQR
ncbi:M23 family metallopeptidase [Magnetovibrio blakemorei]|uniref:LysM domain-containing protein n=1 Tax=Magnetovibrio blakemorei TaxID=28181 RepID=A0A1E5Q6V0_9PROT|nr:peptidoglycan DD-metalloendopeptidase family protein [Magnetovibrio blakemorei]OEJ66747.1 hypothetical protein BEN30_11770 [Magnetovibrio blakemorei]